MAPVQRTARLIQLLLEQPIRQEDLLELLGTSPAQLRRDLAALRTEGWHIEVYGAGRVARTLWISRVKPYTVPADRVRSGGDARSARRAPAGPG